MYCPKCFNNTLKLSSNGVVNVIINGKQMDAGRFLYNLNDHRKDQIVRDLESKLDEFFKWYSNFQNKEPISRVSLSSADFICEEGCSIGLNTRFSIIDILIPRKTVIEKLEELSEKHHLRIELEKED